MKYEVLINSSLRNIHPLIHFTMGLTTHHCVCNAPLFFTRETCGSHGGDCEDYYLWDMTPCILVDRHRHFGGTSCLFLE
jgi:hypothetical protein